MAPQQAIAEASWLQRPFLSVIRYIPYHFPPLPVLKEKVLTSSRFRRLLLAAHTSHCSSYTGRQIPKSSQPPPSYISSTIQFMWGVGRGFETSTSGTWSVVTPPPSPKSTFCVFLNVISSATVIKMLTLYRPGTPSHMDIFSASQNTKHFAVNDAR